MGEFTTALGQTYVIERRLPRLAWRPRYRGADPEYADVAGSGADDGIFGCISAILFLIVLVVIVLPFLLFVLEVAVVVAIVIPAALFALAVGIVPHTVQIRGDGSLGPVLDRREARGPFASRRAAAELRAEAAAGAYGPTPKGDAWVPRGFFPERGA